MKKILLLLTVWLSLAISSLAQPTVTSTNPTKQGFGFTANPTFTITFSEAMNESTVNTSTVIVQGSYRGKYSGSFGFSGNMATFTPTDAFLPNEVITVSITTGVQNSSNVAMAAPYVISFIKKPTAGPAKWKARDNYTVYASNYTKKTVLADLDGDDDLDLVALTPSQDLMSVFLNDGSGNYGTATTYATALNVLDVVVADIDNDGDVDVLTSNLSSNGLSVFVNNGSGTLSKTDYDTGTSRPGYTLAVGDLDGDGWVDAAISDADGTDVYLFFNDGDGTFGNTTIQLETTVAFGRLQIADLDSDGQLDIGGIDGTNNKFRYIRNDGSRAYTVITTEFSVGTTVYDLFITSLSDRPVPVTANIDSDNITTWQPSSLTGNPIATQTNFSAGNGAQAVSSADYSGDGYNDIVVSNPLGNTLSLLTNGGAPSNFQSTFSSSFTYPMGSTYANHIAMGDLDGDGDVDMVTANQDGTFSLIQNYSGSTVASISPVQGNLNVTVDSNIDLTFEEDINAATLTSANLTVIGSVTGVIAGAYSYNSGTKTATFNPTSNFLNGETITVFVTNGVENAAGTPLNVFTSSFTVEANNTGGFFASNTNYTAGDQPQALVQADLNGDGYPDLITANYNASNIEVFINDGDGTFATGVTYASGTNPVGLAVGDVNGDGDIDIVSIANETIIAVFSGNGDGTLNAKATLTTTYNNALPAPTNVALADIDMDGDLDLLYTTSGQMKSQENEGSGTFNNSSEWGYSSTSTKALSADMDSDGDLDLVYAGSTSVVVTTFVNGSPASIPTSSGNQPIDLVIGDFDGDNDIDVVTANTNYGSGTISFYANNGSASLAAKVDYSIGSSIVPKSIASADFDGDGDLDLAVTSYGNDQVVVFANNGSGIFSEINSFTTGDGPFDIVAGDFDRDGNMDVATANENSDNISVLINELALEILSITPSTNALAVTASSNIDIAFNQAINDATFTSADLTVWGSLTGKIAGSLSYNAGSYTVSFNPTSDFKPGENITVLLNADVSAITGVSLTELQQFQFKVDASAEGVFSMGITSNRIETVSPGSQANFDPVAGDMDGDGDVDMVYTSTSSTSYYTSVVVMGNDGSGNLTLLDSLQVGKSGGEVVVADFDGDSDLDVAVNVYDQGVSNDNFIAVAFNDGSGVLSSLATYTISNGTRPLQGLSVQDINNDGYADLITIDAVSGNLNILLNDQDGTFTKQAAKTTGFPTQVYYYNSTINDLNNDGYPDIVASAYNDGSGDALSVFINNGNGTFANKISYSISSSAAGVSAVSTGDIDSDGDNDIVAIGDNVVMTFKNNGDGTFASSIDGSLGDNYPSGVLALADIDSDNDLDIVIEGYTIENSNGSGTFSNLTTLPATNVNGTTIADMDGDGDQDIITLGYYGFTVLRNVEYVSVSSTSPTTNTHNVAVDSDITVTFNTSMNTSSIDNTTMLVTGSSTGLKAGAYSFGGNSVTFNPTTDFKPGEKITVTLKQEIESSSGATLVAPYIFSFQTPTNGDGNLAYRDSLETSANHNRLISFDVDNDGDDDIVTMSYVYPDYLIQVYKNSAGTFSYFSQVTRGNSFETIDAIDVDKDGDLDLALGSLGSSSGAYTAFFENDGNGTFTSAGTQTTNQGYTIAYADFNGDGNLDLGYTISNYYVNIRYGNGDFTFSSQSGNANAGFSAYQFAAGDVDNDGDVDVVVRDAGTALSVVKNNGAGTFGSATQYSLNYSISGAFFREVKLVDVNNDNYLDIVAVGGFGFDILLNNQNGTFSSAAAYSTTPLETRSVQALDYDGDGYLDLAIWAYDNNAEDGNYLLMAYNSNGAFGNQVTFQLPTSDPYYSGLNNWGYTFLDIDGDGDKDLASGIGWYDGTSKYGLGFFLNEAGSATVPTTAASNISLSSKTHSKATINWTNGDGTRRLVVVKEGSAVDATPSDNSGINPNPTFGSGTEIGTGNFAVFGGTSNSTTISGLSSETTYHVQIFELNGVPGSEKFFTTGAPTFSFTTNAPPTIWDKSVDSLTFSKVSYADPTLEANQDRIVDGVWLTTNDKDGIYNAFNRSFFDDVNQGGIEWANGTTADIGTLTFTDFKSAVGETTSLSAIADDDEEVNLVLHILNPDMYVDIRLHDWTSGQNGGGFSYTRGTGSTPTPVSYEYDLTAGTAAQFDVGSSKEEYFEIITSDNEIAVFNTRFTAEMWVKPDVLNQDQVFFEVYDAEIAVGLNASNQFYAYHTQNFSGDGTVTVTGTTTATIGNWYHIAFTAESGGQLKLFVNGMLEDSEAVTDIREDQDYGNYMYLGSDYNGNKNFNGAMDEFRFWSTVRTESEIRSFMYRPYSGPTYALALYYQFNEGEGDLVDKVHGIVGYARRDRSATWVSSTAPLGTGSVTLAESVTTGTNTVGNVSLNITEDFDSAVDVQVTEVTSDPNVFPSGYSAGVGDKYFVINLFGSPGAFSVDLTLTFGPGVITAGQESDPSTLKLHKRTSNSANSWITLGGATTAVSATGAVTWTGITSFSQFMVTEGEGYNLIQLADHSNVVAYDDSTFEFSSSFFNLNDTYVDSTFSVSVTPTPSGTLFLDVNNNGSYDEGTDNLLQNGNSFIYSPAGSTKLRYSNSTTGVETLTVSLEASSVNDAVILDFLTVEGNPSISGTADTDRWVLMANPMTTNLGSLLTNRWTQGAGNSDAPAGQTNMYTFNPNTANWSAITSDLNATTLSTGQGLLMFMFADDDFADEQPAIGGGWPKTFSNYGTPIGKSASVEIKNVDVDVSTSTTGNEGWNIFANPFGWSISIDSVLATLNRADVSANANVYRLNTSGEFVSATTGELPAYESVFIRTMTSGQTSNLSFDDSDIYTSGGAKLAVSNDFFLTLKHIDSGLESKLGISIDDRSKSALDKYDAFYIGSYAPKYANLYASVSDQRLMINHLPETEEQLLYPIHLDANVNGLFELSWNMDNLPTEKNIYLKNELTGEYINLRETNQLEFNNTISKAVSSKLNERTFGSAQSNQVFTLIVGGLLTDLESAEQLPTEVELAQNFPNPFNPSSTIKFGVPSQQHVSLEVFDILGRKVSTLVNETKHAGRYTIQFNAAKLSSGIYFYRLTAGSKVIVKQMTLIK